MRNDMIETGDSVTYKYPDGKCVRAFINELGEDYMVVRPTTIDWEYAGGQPYGDVRYSEEKLTVDMFDDIDLEIWSDGRGGDNSAIGVSGCHEPWTSVWLIVEDGRVLHAA
jgi:hypothetical protein